MKALLVPFILCFSYYSFAQKNESYFIFDADWNAVKNIRKAKFFLHTEKVNDTCWQWDYYNFSGPRIKTESFRDSTGEMPNGFFAYYNAKGYLDSCGYVRDKRKDRNWTYYDSDSGKVYLQVTYNYGKLIKREDYRNRPAVEEKLIDEKTFLTVEKESEFPGGARSWMNFLTSNLTYPERAIDLESQGTVWILFVVDKEGKVIDPILAKSVEFSLDQEALRMMQISPPWTPAFQNGTIVKSWKKQPIVFKLTR